MEKSTWPIRCVWCNQNIGKDWEAADWHVDACRAKNALRLDLKTEWRAWFRGAEGGK